MKRCVAWGGRRWLVAVAMLVLICQIPNLGAHASDVPYSGGDTGRAALLETIESAVRTEAASLEALKDRLRQSEILAEAVATEVNAYKVQNASYANLVLLASTGLADLEKAIAANILALDRMSERLKAFTAQRETIATLQQQTRDQIGLNRQQQAEIKLGNWEKKQRAALLKSVERLAKILSQKEKVLDALHGTLTMSITGLSETRTVAQRVQEKLETQVRNRKKRELFQRNFLLLKLFDLKAATDEIAAVTGRLGRLLKKDFWTDEALRIRESGSMPLLTLGVLLALGALIVARFRRFCRKWETMLPAAGQRWRRLCLTLVRRSALLLGAAAILFGYDLIQFPHYRVPVIALSVDLLIVWAISRWALDFVALWEPDAPDRFPAAVLPRVRALAHGLRYPALGYLIVAWAAGPAGVLLTALRLVLIAGLIVWCYGVQKALLRLSGNGNGGLTPAASTAMLAGYLIALGGLISELAGYPALTVYWYVSWARTAAVAFWVAVTYRAIREWHGAYRQSVRAAGSGEIAAVNPIPLLFIQAAWLLWAMSLIDGLVLAWSSNWEVFRSVYRFMSHPWAIGKINVSLVGVIYALIIFFFTYTLTRVARYVLAERILAKSGMESGLQASIITISVYLMWGLGVIFALGVLGVSATSLAVVFGALSIGIGFGLQNIFNNFISGVILLFERPIQVGDAVEVGGIWGTVTKINVRATIVQTFDNASLIIPNSEFISSQVTNWSFKDQRLRRKVEVGVAYGSDVERVRKTLLEIADRTPNVLKYPKPDVVFMAHGESTLDFVLRYWTFVDHFYTTSTDIRFEMDRLFKERGIEIAFPQRDIHIRSAAAGAGPDPAAGENKQTE